MCNSSKKTAYLSAEEGADAAGACLHVQIRKMGGGALLSGAPAGVGECEDRWHSLYDLRQDRVCPLPSPEMVVPDPKDQVRVEGSKAGISHPPKSPGGSGALLIPCPRQQLDPQASVELQEGRGPN